MDILRKAEPITGPPFAGLAAYRPEQAHLFFGRQKETLDALACLRRQQHDPSAPNLFCGLFRPVTIGSSGARWTALTSTVILCAYRTRAQPRIERKPRRDSR
jgi:hypothetical protein